EPGAVDQNKNRPAQHMRKVQKVERVPKQKERIENNTVVIGMIGTNVILECNVGLNNVTVLWVKNEMRGNLSTFTVLTENTNTLVDDKRFLTVNHNNSRIWSLHVRFAKVSDAGQYECQVCTPPTFSIFVRLELF
uniref:Ig-like domain-containing protein n=1 Tax=Dendroctonus ponderosae TaxID=77166 RepID=A0AAR5QFR8_DENPD